MNKAIFLDRDGTINIDYGYVHKIDKFDFIDGAIEGLKILSDLGYLLIIITNQSGIGRNIFSENDFLTLNNHMLKKLVENGINIDKVYYCPHIDSDNCNCRKPKLELFYKAKKDFDIDFNASFAIGDNTRDLEISNISNVKGILLTEEINNNYICKKNLKEASLYIKEQREV